MSDPDRPPDRREQLEACTPTTPPDAFTDALNGYRAHFGPEHLPHLLHVDEAIAVRVLTTAIARRRPVKPLLISWLSGAWCGPPPPGVLV